MTIQWTVRRLGAHPANQIAREHMLGLVEADDVEAAERAILEAPGVTLYPGQTLFFQQVHPNRKAPRRLERALNANRMREKLQDGYDAWIVSHGHQRFWGVEVARWMREHREEAAVAKQRRAEDDTWLRGHTAWLLRQRDTGKLIYVVANGVWRTLTDDGHAFARWLCGPYRDGARPDLKCRVPDAHGAGWAPLRDRSYDAVAIARRVGEDRVKVIILGLGERWYDNDAQPASEVIKRPVFDSLGRKIANGRMH